MNTQQRESKCCKMIYWWFEKAHRFLVSYIFMKTIINLCKLNCLSKFYRSHINRSKQLYIINFFLNAVAFTLLWSTHHYLSCEELHPANLYPNYANDAEIMLWGTLFPFLICSFISSKYILRVLNCTWQMIWVWSTLTNPSELLKIIVIIIFSGHSIWVHA